MHGEPKFGAKYLSKIRKTSLLPARQQTSQAKGRTKEICSKKRVACCAAPFLFGSEVMYQMAIRQEYHRVKENGGRIYRNLLMLGAIGGILLGVLLFLVGIFLFVEIFLTHIETHRIEVVFLVSSFIFLALGAHCMDKIDGVNKTERIKRSRRQEMPDGNKNNLFRKI